MVRSLLFAPFFPVPSSFKVAALRLFGAKVGNGVVIRSRVNITMPWRLTVGDHVWIGDEVMILALEQDFQALLLICLLYTSDAADE